MEDNSVARSWFGSVLIVSSAVAYSSAGYFTRLIDLDAPTLLFWRGIYAGLFLLVCVAMSYRGKTVTAIREMGLHEVAFALLSALATVCYVEALRLTTVAEVMAIGATSPFVSGALAWLVIGEKPDWKVGGASLVALGGVGVMVGPGALGGHVAGALLAFAMTCAIAGMLVMVRAKRSSSMLPASCVSAFLSALVVWPVTSATIPSGTTMLHLALFGVVQFGLGLILMTRGARRVTALRTSLLGRLQTVLGPTWVWLAFGEMPPPSVLVGGFIVLASTVVAALIVDRSRPALPVSAGRASERALVPASRAS
jgi:drug/metabolite transporter (DMT)-like permease